jgi:hypothetical protein
VRQLHGLSLKEVVFMEGDKLVYADPKATPHVGDALDEQTVKELRDAARRELNPPPPPRRRRSLIERTAVGAFNVASGAFALALRAWSIPRRVIGFGAGQLRRLAPRAPTFR